MCDLADRHLHVFQIRQGNGTGRWDCNGLPIGFHEVSLGIRWDDNGWKMTEDAVQRYGHVMPCQYCTFKHPNSLSLCLWLIHMIPHALDVLCCCAGWRHGRWPSGEAGRNSVTQLEPHKPFGSCTRAHQRANRCECQKESLPWLLARRRCLEKAATRSLNRVKLSNKRKLVHGCSIHRFMLPIQTHQML